MEPQRTQSSLAIPISIILGFALIAAAIYFSGNKATVNTITTTPTAAPAPAPAEIRAVDDTDYIRGNPNAPILIVEYSDYDCPFCKRYHDTMNQIMDEYGVTGKVAWVYRQFPIAQLHPNAPRISEAALCVGELAGNDAFWTFSDTIFNDRGVNEATNMTKLTEYAVESGANETEFNTCLNSGKMKDRVAASYSEAVAAGITGTPQSYVLIGNQQAPIEGAQPYEVVKQIIDNLISQMEGREVNNPS